MRKNDTLMHFEKYKTNNIEMDTGMYDKLKHFQIVTVVAGSNLERGANYGPVSDFDLLCKDSLEETRDRGKIIQIFSCAGTIMSEDRTADWVLRVRLSRDCYEQNLEIYRSRDNQVRVRTTREVMKGEEMKVWYEAAYGRERNVPHLTPCNIKGIQNYQCTECEAVFVYPNTLKMHIMNGCGRVSPWPPYATFRKLNSTYTSNTSKHTEIFNNFEKIRARSDSVCLRFDNMVTGEGKVISEACVCPISTVARTSPLASINCRVSYSANNLFSPYKLETNVAILPIMPEKSHVLDKPIRDDHVTSSMQNSPDKVRTSVGMYPESDDEPIDILHKSFIEFSTKNGHRCVYCGKFYSRKYGLKIHLRTHTGYKPLKCKICLRAFGDPSNLNKHTRLHSEGNTPYKCPHCGKILVRRRDLMRHLNSRHPDRFSYLKKTDI